MPINIISIADIANYSITSVYHGESVWDKCIANLYQLTPSYNVNSLICSGHLLKRMRGQCVASGNDRHIYKNHPTPCMHASWMHSWMAWRECTRLAWTSFSLIVSASTGTETQTNTHASQCKIFLGLVRIRKPMQNLSK